MATLVRDAAPPIRPVEPAIPPSRQDVWPHTRRPMPWLVALFMFMVYMIPFDSTLLPVSLPFNSGLDRLVLIVISMVWLAVSFGGRLPPRFSHTSINVAMWAFVFFTALSIVINLRDLTWDGDLSLAFKQTLLTYTYLLFFFVAASSLTRDDAIAFCKLLVILGTLSAIGTVLEYRTHHDIFGDLARLIPGARVHVKFDLGGGVAGARVSYGGPAKHGLADATMLDTAIPFAIAFLSRARDNWARLGWGLALIILIIGCVATQEKTAFILLGVSLVVTVAFRPRRYARWWPLLVIAIPIIRVAAPHSISGLLYQFKHLGSSSSTTDRSDDYSAVAPFLDTHLLFGRGSGSFDPHKYRILDDEMLGFLVEIGVIGTLSYAAVIFSPVIAGFRRARRGLTLEDDMLAAIAAGCIAFFVSNFLYDSFSFRQGPYVFFFLAALAAAIVGRRGASVPVSD